MARGCTPKSNSAPPPHPAVRKSPQSGRPCRARTSRCSMGPSSPTRSRARSITGAKARFSAYTKRPPAATSRSASSSVVQSGFSSNTAAPAASACNASAAWRPGGVATTTTSAPAGSASYVTGRAPNSLARFGGSFGGPRRDGRYRRAQRLGGEGMDDADSSRARERQVGHVPASLATTGAIVSTASPWQMMYDMSHRSRRSCSCLAHGVGGADQHMRHRGAFTRGRCRRCRPTSRSWDRDRRRAVRRTATR